ncbi:4-hydroxyphenylacetate 3-monooxygenase reductase component [Raoultella terrigena]|uniref:4-hydroxyphenylacetate 3-monooxygenase reductase component n=1 Tax=Raoultella terrigena TaxID=577 RepID=A0A3P8L2I0_RAOTE|nr:4-hydroxyphenylacetate 3-monooxygenase reductase component [Raoultella terrigena]
MQLDEQRLRFRDAMSSLSAAVNVITTEGDAGRCGITATAVCSVTDTPPSVMVCINANSAMNPVFQGNGRLCINVLNHEQEVMARHFAGMTGVTMEERFSLSCWQKGVLGQPVLKDSAGQSRRRYQPGANHRQPPGLSGRDQEHHPKPGRPRADLLQASFPSGDDGDGGSRLADPLSPLLKGGRNSCDLNHILSYCSFPAQPLTPASDRLIRHTTTR